MSFEPLANQSLAAGMSQSRPAPLHQSAFSEGSSGCQWRGKVQEVSFKHCDYHVAASLLLRHISMPSCLYRHSSPLQLPLFSSFTHQPNPF
jgi:hypothetical protein